MAKKRSRVKIKYRQSPILLKCALLAAIIFSTVALLVVKNAVTQEQMEYDALRKAAAYEEHRKALLEECKNEHGTVEDIKRYAEAYLGLVDPDTVFFDVEPKD